LGLSIHASANSVTITAGPFSPYVGGVSANFDSNSFPSNFTASGNAGIVQGSILNVNLAPTGDSTPYVYVDPGGIVTETLGGVTYFGFYWSSPDLYNTLTFTDTNANSTVYGYGGTPVPGLLTDQLTGQYVNFFDSGTPWATVTFTSPTGIAFEFDNTMSGTPEPATLVLLAGGLMAVGAGAIRSRKKVR
jgi:hypothetical protein